MTWFISKPVSAVKSDAAHSRSAGWTAARARASTSLAGVDRLLALLGIRVSLGPGLVVPSSSSQHA
jgi:hypothetical protein